MNDLRKGRVPVAWPRQRLKVPLRQVAGLGLLLIAFAAPAAAQTPDEAALMRALRNGGHVIYFRHAATDWRSDDRLADHGDWTSCDPAKMRQLSEDGRATARRIGAAMRALGIPVGRVMSSEYCRSAETARLLGLGPVETTRDIMNMRAASRFGGREAVVRRARKVLSAPVPVGTNVVIVGHGNLMRAATDAYAGEGGSGIYVRRPARETGIELIARLAPDDWQHLAKRFAQGG